MAIGTVHNNTGIGVIGQLVRKVFNKYRYLFLKNRHNTHTFFIQEVELYIGGELSSDKARFIDVSVPFFYDDIEIMIPYPKKHDNSRAFYEIYTPTAIFRLMCP